MDKMVLRKERQSSEQCGFIHAVQCVFQVCQAERVMKLIHGTKHDDPNSRWPNTIVIQIFWNINFTGQYNMFQLIYHAFRVNIHYCCRVRKESCIYCSTQIYST